MKDSDMRSEIHPIPPFLPEKATVLLLGSFPPPQSKWRMAFFYPNFQNDMWRIFGYLFFDDKNYFIDVENKMFKETRLREFLHSKGVAVSDTAYEVVRLKNNASDNFLKIIRPTDMKMLLDNIPHCTTIITTGKKATETLQTIFSDMQALPEIGEYTVFSYKNRALRCYRLPSSSRAYPLPLAKKAAIYGKCFRTIGLL